MTCSVAFQNCRKIACRSLEDGAVRIFDIRKLGTAEKVWHGIYNNHSRTGIEISPNQQILATGRSFDRTAPGGLVFLDIYGDREEETRQLNHQANQVLNSANKGLGPNLVAAGGQDKNFEGEEFQNQLQRIYADNAKPEEKAKNYKRTRRPDLVLGTGDVIGEISSGKKHVTAVKWPAKLNQIFVGWGNDISILFEKGKSKKGIMPALRKVKTKKKIGKLSFRY